MLRVAVEVNVVVDVVDTVDELVSVVEADTVIVVVVVVSDVVVASSSVTVVLVVDTVEEMVGVGAVTVLVAVGVGMRRHEQTEETTERPSETSAGGITTSFRGSRALGRSRLPFLFAGPASSTVMGAASRRATGASFRW